MTSPISDILNELYLDQPPFASDDPDELIDWRSRAVREANQAILSVIAEAIGPNVDIEQYPKESEERWTAITANAVRLSIRAKLSIPTEQTA